MKARIKTTRWLLISLLFGLLAAAGMILTHHSGVRFVTTASQPVSPKHIVMQKLHAALLAATGGKLTLATPVGTSPHHGLIDRRNSGDPQSQVTDHSDASSNVATTSGAGPQIAPVSNSGNGTPAGNAPATSASSPTAQGDPGLYASNGYIPEECGLPAGCGGGGNASSVTHPPSLTVGNVPVAHNSQDSTPPNDGPSDPGQGSDPPGSGPNSPVAAAPELDPATLGGAITLLLGSLAVLRGRRVRVARAPRFRETR